MPVFNNWELWKILTPSTAVCPPSVLKLILHPPTNCTRCPSILCLQYNSVTISAWTRKQLLNLPSLSRKENLFHYLCLVSIATMSKSFSLCILLVLFLLLSVLSYRSRRKQSVSAGGKRVYRGLSDCSGYTKHLHHGIQGSKKGQLIINDTITKLFTFDSAALFSQNQLTSDLGHNPLMKKVFQVHLCFLQIPQSEAALKQVFTSLRTFIYKVKALKDYGNDTICFKSFFVLTRDTFPTKSCSFPVRSSMAGPTCVPHYATKSSSAVTPSLALSAVMPPISSTSSWKATLTIQDASLSSEPTCRCVLTAFSCSF